MSFIFPRWRKVEEGGVSGAADQPTAAWLRWRPPVLPAGAGPCCLVAEAEARSPQQQPASITHFLLWHLWTAVATCSVCSHWLKLVKHCVTMETHPPPPSASLSLQRGDVAVVCPAAASWQSAVIMRTSPSPAVTTETGLSLAVTPRSASVQSGRLLTSCSPQQLWWLTS